ncbi:hypothetical protein LV89_01029 [Arcicella aurantiaca]|uniref:Uncharacterized protein n=1 Tax=Arcicella aurantiaca TaxID=591202 RepID=A0A316EEW2_9BACT|nr:hypothetical protein LV89_01029 [Arcicella aurantiaca]
MFYVVSNPFVEMAQGAVSNGLGYIAKQSEKSENFAWLWWIAGVLLTCVAFLFFINYQEKKDEKKKTSLEQQNKLAEKQKEITS